MKIAYKYSLLSLPTITILMLGIILASNTVSADDNTSVVDEINITVPISCTISGTGMNTHNANINNGLYVPDIGTTTLHAFCNDNEGFAIYAAGYTGDEVGGTNSNKLVGTTASGNATIESGIATTAGNPDISNWAMKLAITQDSGDTTSTNAFTIDSAPNADLPSEAGQSATQASFSQYHVVPNEYTKVAHKNSVTDMTDTTGGVKLTTTYAAYISKTQAADTYSGQVIYTLVHPSSAAAPILDGCNPTGTTIGANPSTDIVCMQDITSANKTYILASMTEEQQYTLIDKRDGKTYTISKLKDGNIWMTQNLDLDLDSTKTYTNEDTDLGWNISTSTYDTASWTPLRSTYNSSTKTWCQNGTWESLHHYCRSNNTPESYDPGDLYWNGTLVYDFYGDWNTYTNSCTRDETIHETSCDESLNPIDTYVTVSNASAPKYHLGNYYNFTAAVAMNDSSTFITNEQQSNQSICPKGWMLPKSGNDMSTGSFQYLFEQYGWDSDASEMIDPGIWDTAIGLPLSGEWNGIPNDIGYDITLWSSVVGASYLANAAYADSFSYVGSTTGAFRGTGESIRCLVR